MRTWLNVFGILAAGVLLGRLIDGAHRHAEAGPPPLPQCSSLNGDCNADGHVDISDAVAILGNLFLGSPSEIPPLCTSWGTGESRLRATGQSKCYDATGVEIACNSGSCPGQDAVYALGCPGEGRFTDNGDGTVSDHCTGLMWQKDTADVDGDGQLTLLDFLRWCDTLTYCEHLDLGGHDDWRLPNIVELESLIDYGRTSPSIDPVFEAFPGAYASSTSSSLVPQGAWIVVFLEGGVTATNKGNQFFVRAVRTES